jgi:mannose/fructose-specific phosphotransferase system component IIA
LGCSDPETIFLTDGTSGGVQNVLNLLIRTEKDGVSFNLLLVVALCFYDILL